jgi:hypothetical protein
VQFQRCVWQLLLNTGVCVSGVDGTSPNRYHSMLKVRPSPSTLKFHYDAILRAITLGWQEKLGIRFGT